MLGLPPAFALSQDQTLKLDEIDSRQITRFDEVHHYLIAPTIARLKDISDDLKRRPPKSLPDRTLQKSLPFPIEEAVRKDSAVHVSLSSDSLVKQPGNPGGFHPPGEPRKPTKLEPPTSSRRSYPHISEELQRRAIAP